MSKSTGCTTTATFAAAPGGWYASAINDPYSQQVVCSNAKDNPPCFGASCSESIPTGVVGYCMCEDYTVRFVRAGHEATNCDKECRKPLEAAAEAWDAAFLACTASGDTTAAACRRGNRGTTFARLIFIMICSILALVVVSILLAAPSQKNLKQLKGLRAATAPDR